jgi:hypothetical protein
MSKPELIKKSGWAFIAGAVAFITILTGSDPIAIPGSVASAILLAVGMSALRATYGERAGSFGRSMLLLGMLGPVLWFFIIAFMALTVTETQVKEGLWVLIFVGPAISLLGLTLFGLVALRNKPMPRLNWLPLLAGIWYPVAYIFLSYDILHERVVTDQYLPALAVIALIQFFALFVLGVVLVTDTPQKMATV